MEPRREDPRKPRNNNNNFQQRQLLGVREIGFPHLLIPAERPPEPDPQQQQQEREVRLAERTIDRVLCKGGDQRVKVIKQQIKYEYRYVDGYAFKAAASASVRPQET